MTDDASEIRRAERLFAAQRAAATPSGPSAEDRRRDLAALQRLVVAEAEAIAAAIAADFGTRSAHETLLAEVFYVVEAAKYARRHLGRWMRPRRVRVQPLLFPGSARVMHQPKGVVGIIAPWNYPVQLTLMPLVDALAAGCRAIVKPSEQTPRTAALLRDLVNRIFPEDQVAVVTGGPEVSAAVAALPFDHLFFTGSAGTGRKVAAAAAGNLTPVTLELGGKSPAIVAEGYPIETAARSIAWTKLVNAGQTCIAPDYVLAPMSMVRPLAEAILAAAATMYPGGAGDDDYASIVSDGHVSRLETLLRDAATDGATVLRADGNTVPREARKLAPTVVLDPPEGSALMREEIFGPILPIVGVASLDEAIAFVNRRDAPLSLYVYARNRATAEEVLSRTVSGGATVNQALLHMALRDAPFGGVGASGIGAYHGRAGFLTFSHQRTVFRSRPRHPAQWLAPPYGRFHRRFLKWRLRG
ncbi:MAG: coniferyl aldehyde dehydrogenase [Bauldia sp.]|nr:coniferyl aldehyde dehydrogenase [Bauldia sp.]